MAILPPLWKSEPFPNNPNSQSNTTSDLRYRQRYPSDVSIDLVEWLGKNEPKNSSELSDLRRGLYARRSTGKYSIRIAGYTQTGEEKILLKGPTSAVLIVSNKSRHFLLRTLCRLRVARGWSPINS